MILNVPLTSDIARSAMKKIFINPYPLYGWKRTDETKKERKTSSSSFLTVWVPKKLNPRLRLAKQSINLNWIHKKYESIFLYLFFSTTSQQWKRTLTTYLLIKQISWYRKHALTSRLSHSYSQSQMTDQITSITNIKLQRQHTN